MKNNEIITKMYDGEDVEFRINRITGQSEVKIDNVARFCGWERTEFKNGKEYTSLRMATVNKFLHELGFANEMAKGDFIPEYIMYPLIGKANNDRATKFMLWVGKVLAELRINGIVILDDAKPEQVKTAVNKWARQSIYLTEEIHDRKSIRKFIRDYDPMKLDECIDTIAEMCSKMKGSIKHDLLDVAIKELKDIDAHLMKDTIKNTYIKDTAVAGIVLLQDVKIDKYKRKLA